MKFLPILFISIVLLGCSHLKAQPVRQHEIILKFQNEIPIDVIIFPNNKSCDGNWNFCFLPAHLRK